MFLNSVSSKTCLILELSMTNLTLNVFGFWGSFDFFDLFRNGLWTINQTYIDIKLTWLLLHFMLKGLLEVFGQTLIPYSFLVPKLLSRQWLLIWVCHIFPTGLHTTNIIRPAHSDGQWEERITFLIMTFFQKGPEICLSKNLQKI
jgi:hypothetical protein